jgi:hypothetical protein
MTKNRPPDWRAVARYYANCLRDSQQGPDGSPAAKEATAAKELLEDYEFIENETDIDSLSNHPVLRALSGENDRPRSCTSDSEPIRPLFMLDQGQEAAVTAALRGNPITVIGGPPGCGKSQVVAALMLECWIRGVSAMFVAATNEAVDVVGNRIRSKSGQRLVAARHGNIEKSDLLDCLRELESGGGSVGTPRARHFPPLATEERSDVDEAARLQRQLETFTPDAVAETVRVVEEACELARQARERSHAEDSADMDACTFGIHRPTSPAEAARMASSIQAWLNELSEVSRVKSEAESRRESARREIGELCERVEKLAKPESMNARSALMLGKKLAMLAERILDIDGWDWSTGSSSSAWTTEHLTAEIQSCLTWLQRVEELRRSIASLRRFPGYKSLDADKTNSDRLALLLKWTGQTTVTEATFPAELRPRISRCINEWKQAETDVALAKLEGPLAGLLPWSRLRRAESTKAERVREANNIAGAICASRELESEACRSPESLRRLLKFAFFAHELSRSKKSYDSVLAALNQMNKQARALLSPADLSAVSADGTSDPCNELQEVLEGPTARANKQLRTLLLKRCADQTALLLDELNRAGMAADEVAAAASEPHSWTDDAGNGRSIIVDGLKALQQHVATLAELLGKREHLERSIDEVPTSQAIVADWSSRCPDMPADLADGMAKLGEDGLTKEIGTRLLRHREFLMRWETRRLERAAVASAIERGAAEARTAIAALKPNLSSEKAARILRACEPTNPADWDAGQIAKELEDATPEHIARLRDEVSCRIITRERGRIRDALHATVGKIERAAIKSITRAGSSQRTTSHDPRARKEYAENFRNAIRACPLLLTTTKKTFDRVPMAAGLFDIVIIDEASQATIADVLPAIIRSKRLVVIGDRNQLPPRTPSRFDCEAAATEAGIRVSDIPEHLQDPFASVYSTAESASRDLDCLPALLNGHYRSHPAIIGFANRNFYEGKLQIKSQPTIAYPLSPAGMYGADVPGDPRRVGYNNSGTENSPQADWIAQYVRELRLADQNCDIGIACTHRAQIAVVRRKIDELANVGANTVQVGTVDAFQGAERDHIIFNVPSAIGEAGPSAFVSARERVNVAVTRARRSLTLVADLDGLRRDHGPLGQLAKFIASCDRMRRTSRGAAELFGWLLVDDVRIDGDEPECDVPNQRVTFHVRDVKGRRCRIQVVPSDSSVRGNSDGVPTLTLTSTQIIRGPRSAAAAVRRFREDSGKQGTTGG